MSPEITPATEADRGRVVATLVAAFRADPVIRYLFPDDATYPELSAAFFGHLFDKRLHRNAIWIIERGASVAVWSRPDQATGTRRCRRWNCRPTPGRG